MTEASDRSEGPAPATLRATLAAALVIVLLILAGLWLGGVLGQTASTQDCLASGRTNCAPVASGRP